MFWGLIMEPGMCYTQNVKVSFHISMASIDISNASNHPSQLMCVFEGRNYLLCTLNKTSHVQCALDLNFEAGSKVSFATNGQSHIHLTGYLTGDEGDVATDFIVKSERTSLASDEKNEPAKKKRKKSTLEDLAGSILEEESSDSDFDADEWFNEDDEDSMIGDEEDEDILLSEDADDDDLEEEEEVEEEEQGVEEEEDEEEPIEKLPVTKAMNGVSKKKNKREKSVKKEQEESPKKSPSFSKTEQKQQKKVKRTLLKGGVIVDDLTEGTGEPVKSGKFVSVYYEGRLKDSNKKFDANHKGPGFGFKVGKGEVIRGWDVGIVGMKVGGKRRLTCPPAMGYGAKGSPPVIPPNATLVFDIELKKIN